MFSVREFCVWDGSIYERTAGYSLLVPAKKPGVVRSCGAASVTIPTVLRTGREVKFTAAGGNLAVTAVTNDQDCPAMMRGKVHTPCIQMR